MTLRAVFIDVGNTLLYEDPSRFRIYALAAEKRGLGSSEGPSERTAELKKWMRRVHGEIPVGAPPHFRYGKVWFREFIRRIFHVGLGLPERDLPELEQELFAHFDDPDSYRLRDGVVEILTMLADRGDLVLGVISNGTDRLPGLLEGLGLAQYFDFVLSSALFGFEKPSREIFEEALRLAGVRPHEAVHVGDSVENDVSGAMRSGLQAVLFDPKREWQDENPSYDRQEFDRDPRFSRVESFAQLGKDLTDRLSSGSPPPSR